MGGGQEDLPLNYLEGSGPIHGQSAVSLFDRDEGWHGQTVREMFNTNDWIVPRYLGESRYHKTPLLYWCSAVSVSALGWSEFSLRLPCLLASIAAWTVVATVAARWSGRSYHAHSAENKVRTLPTLLADSFSEIQCMSAHR